MPIKRTPPRTSITKAYLPKTQNDHGKLVPCINGCGRMVHAGQVTCKYCKREAKIKKLRELQKTRKNKKKDE